jgi:hypothetical protein
MTKWIIHDVYIANECKYDSEYEVSCEGSDFSITLSFCKTCVARYEAAEKKKRQRNKSIKKQRDGKIYELLTNESRGCTAKKCTNKYHPDTYDESKFRYCEECAELLCMDCAIYDPQHYGSTRYWCKRCYPYASDASSSESEIDVVSSPKEPIVEVVIDSPTSPDSDNESPEPKERSVKRQRKPASSSSDEDKPLPYGYVIVTCSSDEDHPPLIIDEKECAQKLADRLDHVHHSCIPFSL